jgi:integrase
VAALHAELAPTPYMANRVLTVLRAMFGHAEREEWRAPHTNPGVGVDKYPEAVRAHSLTADEYAALGAALARIGREGFPRAEGAPAPRGDVVDVLTPLQRRTLALFRFLALSGWRESEGRTLQWADVDTARGVAILGTTKTGRSVRPLGAPALAVLADVRALPVEGPPSPYVFPGAAARASRRTAPTSGRRGPGCGRPPASRSGCTTCGTRSRPCARGLGYGDHVIAGLVGHAVRGGVTSRTATSPTCWCSARRTKWRQPSRACSSRRPGAC